MTLKELATFLKPSLRKIKISLGLLIVYLSMFAVLWMIVYVRTIPSSPILGIVMLILVLFINSYFILAGYPAIVLYTVSPSFTVIALAFYSYLFGCYVNTGKRLIERSILYFAVLAIMGGMMYLSVYSYNYAFAFSCEKESDCSIKCDDIMGNYPVNKNFIYLLPDSCGFGTPVCVNNRCANAENR